MIFRNPVRGTIRPTSWKRPAGNHEPRLVRGFLGTNGSLHDGLDISTGRVGDPILAAAAGRVIWAKQDGGLYVVIEHADPYRTLYGHLKDEVVSVGQRVSKGQLIGHLGYSGFVIPAGPAGAHLHFEVFLDSTRRVNPWPLLAQNVTVRPQAGDGIRIRSSLSLGGSAIYATTRGGRIRREDGTDLGAQSTRRKWGGTVTGPTYTVPGFPGGTSNRWERIYLGGAYRFIAAKLAERSAY